MQRELTEVYPPGLDVLWLVDGGILSASKLQSEAQSRVFRRAENVQLAYLKVDPRGSIKLNLDQGNYLRTSPQT